MENIHRWLALIGICLLTFTAFLDYTIVNTALPFIQQEFQASIIQLQWIMNIFAMILSMTMVLWGRLADIYGRRKIFYLGVLFFMIGAVGSALAPTITILIFFRGIQALGAAILFTVSTSMIPQLFPPTEHSKAISIYSALTGLGLAIGPFLGGLIINWLNWRWIFWINVPIIIVGFYFCLRYLAEFPKLETKIGLNIKGVILLIASLGFLIYGIILSGQGNTRIENVNWFLIMIGLVLFILFYKIESNSQDPIIDFNIFKYKYIILAMLNCFIAGIVCFILLFSDSLYLKLIYEYPALFIGIVLVVPSILQVIISFLFEKITKYFSIKNILLFSMAMGFLACFFHALVGISAHASLIILLIGLFFLGINWGLTNPISIMAASQSVKPDQMGVTLGTIFTIWNISGAVFLAIGSVILHNVERSHLLHYLATLENLPNAIQQQLISLALNESSDIKQKTLAIVGPEHFNHILVIFKNAFTSGYHVMAMFATVVSLIILLIAMGFKKT